MIDDLIWPFIAGLLIGYAIKAWRSDPPSEPYAEDSNEVDGIIFPDEPRD